MTQRPWSVAVLALLVMASFAGCLGDDEDPKTKDTTADDETDDQTDDTSGETSDDDTGTGTGGSGGAAENQAPTASFAVNLTDIQVGDDVGFNASASSDPEGGALTYLWDFGDGSTADGASVNHTFAAPGNFTVNLTVTDDGGLTAVASETLAVADAAVQAGVIFSQADSLVAPNPVLGPLAVADKTLATHKIVGGVEGTHWVTFTIENAPTDVPGLRFKATGYDTTFKMGLRIFPAAGGDYIASSLFPTGGPDVTLTGEQLTETTYVAFMWINAGADLDFTFEVSVEEAAA